MKSRAKSLTQTRWKKSNRPSWTGKSHSWLRKVRPISKPPRTYPSPVRPSQEKNRTKCHNPSLTQSSLSWMTMTNCLPKCAQLSTPLETWTHPSSHAKVYANNVVITPYSQIGHVKIVPKLNTLASSTEQLAANLTVDNAVRPSRLPALIGYRSTSGSLTSN